MGAVYVHGHELHLVCSYGNVLNYMQNDWHNIYSLTVSNVYMDTDRTEVTRGFLQHRCVDCLRACVEG